MDKEQIIYDITFTLRRGTKDDLLWWNGIPAQGEPIYELDTSKLKIGDGTTAYSNLPYVADNEALNLLQEKVDTFLADADLNEAAVDTLKEIQKMLNENTLDLAELVKKIAEFEELHAAINASITEIREECVAADQVLREAITADYTEITDDLFAADKEISNMIAELKTECEAADQQITIDYKAADEAIKDEYKAADQQIINNFTQITDDLVATDKEINTNIENLTIQYQKADKNLSDTINLKADQTTLDAEVARAKDAEAQTLTDAKAYTDKVKNDLLGDGISETFDTLVEIQDWINGDGVNATELTEAIAEEAAKRLVQDEALNTRVDDLTAQHTKDIEIINNEFEKAYDQQTEAFNNYISEVRAELEEDDRNNLAEAKSYTDSAKSALFGEGSANFDTIVKLSAKTQELIDTYPTYVAEQIAISETNIKDYLDQKIGEIENGAY